MKGLIALALAALAAQPVKPPQSAAEIISAEKLPIARSGPTGYSGAGWDRLIAEGRAAQFFMIGEQHGVADIILAANLLHRELAASGYTHGAVEIGPHSTDFAERLIRRRRGELARYIAAPGHGFTLPFLFFAEEIAGAEQQVAMSPDKQKVLFGLDQEFVGAAPIAAELLQARVRTPAQSAALARFNDRLKADAMLVGGLGPAELDPLNAAFQGDREAGALIEALRTSAEIYRPFIKREGAIYPANLARETYMKRNFVRDFEAAEKRMGRPPRVFMKFGANHAMRGHSLTEVPALGNFLAEWGIPRGFTMVNVMIDCIGGEMMMPTTGKPGPCQPYLGENTLIGTLATDPVTLIHLRPLRARLGQLKDADERTRQLIRAFDYYLVIRDPRAATLVGEGLPAAPGAK